MRDNATSMPHNHMHTKGLCTELVCLSHTNSGIATATCAAVGSLGMPAAAYPEAYSTACSWYKA
eukprot:1522381-Rhodomonas_salina.1